MKNKITPDEFFKLFGKMMSGLSVPGSAAMLGAAREPWTALYSGLGLFNYPGANECEKAAREVFGDLTINANLLEACKAAHDVWDSNSASLDPDEVKEMLTDAIEKGERSPAERSKSLVSAYNAIFIAFEHIEDGNPKQAWRILRTFINEQSSEKETKTDVE